MYSLTASLGMYVVGMPLFQTIQVIKSQDVAIKGVHLCYNEQVSQ